ncbi:MAG: glycosyltransferase [Prevotellaceae bacterium]|nr:glycosyltransferase [Prevotellaceae bacterium]
MTGLFNDSYPPIVDGVALTVQNYAYWLHKKNRPVCVVTVKSPDVRSDDDAAFPVYRYTSVPLLIRKPFRIGLPMVDFSYRRTIDAIPFTLIHAHCPFAAGYEALRIARKRRIPLVATFHSKYRDDFERAVHSKQIAQWMVKQVIAFYEQADEVWIPQPAVEATIRAYGYKGRVTVVGNGTDLSAAGADADRIKQQAREALQIPRDRPVLLFIGQHIWEKNPRLILDALALMKETPFQLFFIGAGYAAREMQELTDKIGLSDKVAFLGMILDRELLKRYYAAADLFLFPSLYDNAPLVVREAAAMHTPSLLLKDSTAAEIITDGYNGFLSAHTREAFAGRIRSLIAAPETLAQAGRNAANTIARSWESVADEVIDRYSQLIARYAATH